MANSRIYLVCKHCGEGFCLGKGYYGGYTSQNEDIHDQLNAFYRRHEHGLCSDAPDCSDNARNHFAVLEEGETLEVLTADVVPKSEVEELKNIYKKYNKAIRHERVEVSREIFEEIEKLSHKFMNDEHYIFGDMVWDIAELKKKYTEEKE